MKVRYVLDVAKRRVVFNSKKRFKYCITFPVKRVEELIDMYVAIHDTKATVVFQCNDWKIPKTNPVIYDDGNLLQVTELLQNDLNGKITIYRR